VPRRRRAYTLLEIVLVMALVVIFAAIAVPTISTMYASYKVRAASDTIRAGYAQARSHAIEESRRYRVGVIYGKANYRVAPDAPEYWSGGTPPSDAQNPAYVLEDALPGGIAFGTPNSPMPDDGDTVLPPDSVSPGMYTTVAVFESDGTSRGTDGDDVVIILQKPGAGPPLTVYLRGLTGTATVRKGAAQ